MGYSHAIFGKLTIPQKRLADFRAAECDPEAFDDWPTGWPGGPTGPVTVRGVLAAIENAEMGDVDETGGKLFIRAIVSNDSDLWLTLRGAVMMVARVAADHGGKGELATTGYIDGGPEDVLQVKAKGKARGAGSSEVTLLTGKAAERAGRRIHRLVEELVEDFVAANIPTIDRLAGELKPKKIAAIHAEVVKALRPHGAKARKALKTQQGFFAAAGMALGDFAELTQLFDTDPALFDALALGWEGMGPVAVDQIPTMSLVALTAVDAKAARKLGQAYLDAKAKRTLKEAAQAAVMDLGSEAEALLDELAASLPTAHHMLHATLAKAPLVAKLRKSKRKGLREAVRARLRDLVGDPSEGKGWARRRQPVYVEAYALSLVLESGATSEDEAFLLRLWTTHHHYMLSDLGRVRRHGAQGKAALLAVFGQAIGGDWAWARQGAAAKALVDADPEGAAGRAMGLLDDPHDEGLMALTQLLPLAQDTPAWRVLLDAIVTRWDDAEDGTRQVGIAQSAGKMLEAWGPA